MHTFIGAKLEKKLPISKCKSAISIFSSVNYSSAGLS